MNDRELMTRRSFIGKAAATGAGLLTSSGLTAKTVCTNFKQETKTPTPSSKPDFQAVRADVQKI